MAIMTSSRSQGYFVPGLISLGIILVLVLLVSGCTQPAPSPSVTPTPAATQTSDWYAKSGIGFLRSVRRNYRDYQRHIRKRVRHVYIQ